MSENKLDHLADVLADIGRTPKGARFLNRLLYWWPKATTVHDDKAWIYRNGREEWASEIGVPLRRFEWLVTMFRADDLIETRAYQLVNNKGRSWGTKVQHVRPSDRLLRIIKERTGRTIGGPEVPASGGANDGSPTAQPPSALQAPSATSCGESPQHVADLYNKDTTYPSSKTNNEIDKKEGAPVPGDALTSPKKEKYLGENINKEAYPASLPLIKEKLRSGGILIIDNILWSGRIFDKKNKAESTEGVREFTKAITQDPDWIVSLAPVRDGVIVAYKK